MKRLLGWWFGCLALPSAALAVSTQSFVIDSHEAFSKGKLEGTASHASGKLTRGVSVERSAVEGAPVAYASAVGPDGAIYIGTGNDGAVYRVDPQGAKRFADTDAALITSLVWAEGVLYAGSLPGGRVFAIDKQGKVQERARLEGSEHVWALGYDPKQRTLYAATGPTGKLFALPQAGGAKLLHDDAAEHLLSLDLDAQGRVYVGTSNGARLVRIEAGKASVLYDFPGQELTALDVGTSAVAVAANEFPEPPQPGAGDPSKDQSPPRLRRPRPGKGKVFLLGLDGHLAELYESSTAHVSAVELETGEHAVQVGLAQDGRVLRVGDNGEQALWADADERQVVAIHLVGSAPHFLTSDGTALYRVRQPNREGQWTSGVLDAKVPARFGELALRARGEVRWSTRSGQTETPDESWSEWSASAKQSAPIRSPSARFLQVRATLVDDAELFGVSAFYLPQNQPARIRNVRLKSGKPDVKPGTVAAHSSVLTLVWDVDNPDDDRLRYRVFYRNEAHASWLPALREHEPLTQAEYGWETRSLPDGHYRVRVEVSDEESNPEAFVERAEAFSGPLLVDNHAPELAELRVQGKQLSGKVRDALGPLQALEVAIDGAPYRPIFPEDGLLDTREERFRLDLSKLAPGTHMASVRATDAALNVSAEAVEFEVER